MFQSISISAIAPALSLFIISSIVACRAQESLDEHTRSEPKAPGRPETRQLIRDFTHHYVESSEDLPFSARFLGLQIMQNPADMWAIQEIISDVQPDVVIETGTAGGGSALYYATILKSVNPTGHVITIDIEPRVEAAIARIASPDLRARVAKVFDESIEVIESNSIDPELAVQLAKRTGDKRVLVVLDSCHHSQHVLRELEMYSPLVSKGSYIIVQDTVIDQKQEWIDRYAQCHGYEPEAGPGKAVADFLRQQDTEFEVDSSRERYLLTFCPGGFLERK